MSSLSERQRAMYEEWARDQKEEQIHAMLKSLEPLMRREVEKYSRYPIPQNVLWTQANILAANAIRNYDPTRGASLATHVVHNLRPMGRFVAEKSNVKYVPETVRRDYGRYEQTQRQLSDKLGRLPTTEEVAKAMKIPADRVERIIMAKSPELQTSVMEEDDEASLGADRWRRAQGDRLAYLRAELKGNERKVFDLLMGRENRPPMTNKGDVAKKVGIPVEDVYSMTRGWSRRLDD